MAEYVIVTGYLPSAACFIMAGYVDESQPGLAILLICLAEGLHAATRSGHTANHVDVCGRYVYIIMLRLSDYSTLHFYKFVRTYNCRP